MSGLRRHARRRRHGGAAAFRAHYNALACGRGGSSRSVQRVGMWARRLFAQLEHAFGRKLYVLWRSLLCEVRRDNRTDPDGAMASVVLGLGMRYVAVRVRADRATASANAKWRSKRHGKRAKNLLYVPRRRLTGSRSRPMSYVPCSVGNRARAPAQTSVDGAAEPWPKLSRSLRRYDLSICTHRSTWTGKRHVRPGTRT